MHIADLMQLIERRAPAALAEDWDNVGLLVGRPTRPVGGVLVALDLRPAVVEEAVRRECDAVLVHHPPIFPALAAFTDTTAAGDAVLRAAEERIAVIAAHTNLDAARGGLNDIMAAMLGITETRPLAPAVDDAGAGLGRVGAVDGLTVGDLVRRAAAVFPAPVVHTGDPQRPVRTVACCTGSGGSLIGAAIGAGADVYVTGDLKYHDVDRAGDLTLIGVPHAGVEAEALRRWAAGLREELAGAGVALLDADTDTDPWRPAPGEAGAP